MHEYFVHVSLVLVFKKKCGSIISVKPMHFMIMWSIKWFPSTNRKWYVIKYIAAQRKIFLLVITMKVNPVWISSRICAFDFIYKQNNKSSTLLLRHSQVGDKLSSLFTWSHDHLCN